MSDRKNWFKRKKYGIGWTPGTSKAWLLLIVYVVSIAALAFLLLRDIPENTITTEVIVFLVATFILTLGLILFGSKRSPSNKWSWGNKDNDKESE